MESDVATVLLDSPIGLLALEADERGLRRIRFAAHESDRHPPPPGSTAGRILVRSQAQLSEYFAGERRHFDLTLAGAGTDFQREVWSRLASIPFGRTRSYGEVARDIGRPRALRAVGAATGANPLPIVVPCHRVIGGNRRLTGFAGGLEAKRWLLEHEGLAVEGDRLSPDPPLAFHG